MKTSEFKEILKPLIEQTVREVLLQEGVLSKVVSEVAKGLNQNLIVENNSAPEAVDELAAREKYEKQRKQRIKMLNESTGIKSKVFENVSELPQGDNKSALSGISPADRGVDISAIEKLSSGKWKLLAGRK
tara:strand:- start:1159 stop:1551 length:393 start_codon:yes stop_codon:yes gene_type:complete